MENAKERRNLLEQSRLFKDFAPAVIDAIVPLLSPCDFEKDNMICFKDDESDCLYIVRDGQAEVTVSSSDGKIILLGTLSRGDVFGEVGLLDKESRTADVSAKTDISLYRLTSQDFEKITKLFGVNEFMALTSYICFLFRGVTNNLQETVFLDASIRVAKKIQTLFKQSGQKGGGSFDVAISQESLGRMAGLSREATNKALARLEEIGLIELKYRRIIVPDTDKFLKAVAND